MVRIGRASAFRCSSRSTAAQGSRSFTEPDRRGEKLVDDSFLVCFNASDQQITFTIPDEVYGEGWLVALDTHDDEAGSVSIFEDATTLLPGIEFEVADRSVVVLRRPRAER